MDGQIQTFTFATLKELRDFLNQFEKLDLDAVHPSESDYITLYWIERKLSDNCMVNDVSITTC
jgi:hypothetical protein